MDNEHGKLLSSINSGAIESRIGPTEDNPKLRHFYWLLMNRLTARLMTNKNDVI